MPSAMDWNAESLPGCQIRVEAHATTGAPLRLRVDGVEVATGQRELQWTGPAFSRGERATVQVGEEPVRELSAIHAETVRFTAAGATGFGPGPEPLLTRRVPLRVQLDTSCPLDGYTWTLRAADSTWTGAFTAANQDVSVALPMGRDQPVAIEVSWRGQSVFREERRVNVSTGCRDDDGDGLCRHADGQRPGWDCADATPWVRPGLPELPGDGWDNDCDGTTAADVDRDGDGYFASARATPTAAQLEQIRAVFADRPELVERLLAAEPFETDCDDADPEVHPHAPEVGLGRDEDCDGEPGDWLIRWWANSETQPEGFPADDRTARDVARITSDSRLQVRDGAQIWTSEPLEFPNWRIDGVEVSGAHPMQMEHRGAIRAVLRSRTATGRAAWIVVVEESTTGNLTTWYTRRVGWVLVPNGSGALTASRLDLGRRSTAMGVGPSSLVMPILTADGVQIGEDRHRWEGDELVKVAR